MSPRTTRTSSAPRSRRRPRSTRCIEFAKDLYALFDVTPHAELSTRPDNRLGTEEEWDHAEGILQAALERHGIEYVVSPGEGTFYGPKIDLHMSDAIGRTWQMGTIQPDYQMPRQFGLTYMGADNAEHTPMVVHRALLGSLERFIGILTEHYAGAFPFWLAPVQLRLIPVAENHREAVARAAASGSRRRATASTSTSATRRSGSGSATPSSRRSPSRSSTATASRTSRSRCGSAAAGSRR